MLVLQVVTPYWWWLAVVPFPFGLLARSGWNAARTGLFSGGLLWLAGSLFFYFTRSRIIAARMAHMFGMRESWLMIIATCIVAAITSGISAYAGYSVRTIFRENKEKQ
jgi:hypothetical protein